MLSRKLSSLRYVARGFTGSFRLGSVKGVFLLIFIGAFLLGWHTSLSNKIPNTSTSSESIVSTLRPVYRRSLKGKPPSSLHDSESQLPRTTIAICALTRSKPSWRSLGDTALQRVLIPSVAKTVSLPERARHAYELHIGADHDDKFWRDHYEKIEHPKWLTIRMYFYEKTKQHRLPFNELTADAYESGADYIVRVNDDTEFVTSGWTTSAISVLRGFNPPNVGVVGPRFREGNTAIMTHDMVHRTHLDIFETYYPSVFDNWYTDDWISLVYGKARTVKLDDWWVRHRTNVHGQRYAESRHQHALLKSEVKRGAAKIDAWLARDRRATKVEVISYEGQVWNVPAATAIAPVVHATVLPPNGQVRNDSGVYGFGKWYWEHKNPQIRTPRLLDDPVLSLVQIWNDRFQHIVFDTVPKLSFVCPFLLERPGVRVVVMNALQRDLVIEACPLRPTRFVFLENGVRAPVVYVPFFVGDNLKMGMVPPNSVRPLSCDGTAGSDVVYLARNAGTTRSVANEAEVLATLRQTWPNLKVVFPTNDWRKDRASVCHASVIIGPHGGALANMIFAPANTTIIEFTPLVEYKRIGKNERPCYFGLAHGLGFRYHAVAPSTFDFDRGSMVVPTAALTKISYFAKESWKDRSLVTRPPPGTQMGPEQIASIQKALGPNGNLLVWGLGNDSPFWNDATTGRVAFIEDDIPDAKAGTQWYNVITQKYPFLEAYKVHYHTDTVKSFAEYIDSPHRWHELRLSDLPASIRSERWDVILVDAPLGCCNAGPGRYQSIYETWRLASNTTHVFVDDYERKVEREFSKAVFGRAPDSITKRKAAASNANEQAHFKPSAIDSWTVLVTVNSGFYDFFQNWWAFFQKLRLPYRVVVVAEDDAVSARLKTTAGITVERSRLTHPEAHSYDSATYKEMVSTRAGHILRHLRAGENVLYTDVDTVWLRNPTDYFPKDADLVAQVDSQSHEGFSPYYCTGLMGIRHTPLSIRMIEGWDALLAGKPQLNQPVFNRAVHEIKGLRHAGLQDTLFPSGQQYFDVMNETARRGVAVVHNNFIVGHDAKKKRFQKFALWTQIIQSPVARLLPPKWDEVTPDLLTTWTPTNTHRTVIIAAAVGYGPLEFRRFLVPLRRVYDGDVVLFVDNNPPTAVVKLCEAYKITTRVLPTKSKWGISSDRFVGYAEACSGYDWCFATDFRDVFFQANPFASIPTGYDLILAQEHATKKIKDCPYNSGWIKDCYGIATLETIGYNSIICSGTLMGTPVGFEHLKHAMLQEMHRTSTNKGCWADQGHLNYLYYSNKLRVPTLVQPRGKGIVNTVGYIPRTEIGNYLNERGLVKNDDGLTSAVVHQYDRFPKLVSLAQSLAAAHPSI